MKTQVISLGKRLVQELGLEPGVDTLSKWMAHYVAEQITTAENATGDAKAGAEQRCFETVLKLWERRSLLPNGRRPFESFERIFRALDHIDPEKPRSCYFDDLYFHESKADKTSQDRGDAVQSWVDTALAVDRAARVLIEFAFTQAARNAADEKTKAWITIGAKMTGAEDISVILSLLPTEALDVDEKTLQRIRKTQKKELRSKMKELDVFSKYSKSVRAALKDQLEKLSE